MEYWVTISEAARLSLVPLSTLHRWVSDARLTTQVRESGLCVDLGQVAELLELRGSGGRLPRPPRSV